jgi:hypothetical protein
MAMRILLISIMLLAIPCIGHAHPGIGIVKDRKGNIFYTDLKQVWKIAKDGKRTIVVPNVHTHELYVDPNDNLYGEHLWYNGERLNTWGHYVWRLHANGKLDTVINPSEGFLANYSFVRDAAGNMYWAERFKITRFKKKSTNGGINTITEGKFKDIRWMYANSNGVVYFIDLLDLYKIEPGKQHQLVAEDISNSSNLHAPITNSRHNLMGIWTDIEENIYVANYSGQVVKKISSDGIVSKIAFSTAPWSPTGGVFDDQGNLWLLEYSVTNEARVRKIPAIELGKEGNTALRQFNNNVLPPLLLVGGVAITILLIGVAARTIKAKLSC